MKTGVEPPRVSCSEGSRPATGFTPKNLEGIHAHVVGAELECVMAGGVLDRRRAKAAILGADVGKGVGLAAKSEELRQGEKFAAEAARIREVLNAEAGDLAWI